MSKPLPKSKLSLEFPSLVPVAIVPSSAPVAKLAAKNISGLDSSARISSEESSITAAPGVSSSPPAVKRLIESISGKSAGASAIAAAAFLLFRRHLKLRQQSGQKMSLYGLLLFWLGSTASSVALGYNTKGKLQFFVRALVLLNAVGIAAFVGCILAVVFSVIGWGYKTNKYVGRTFNYLTTYMLGTKFVADDPNGYLEKTTPAVICVNHQASLDMAAVGCVFPTESVILAKKELIYAPILGQYTYLAKNIFINRSNRNSAWETMAEVGRLLVQSKLRLFMFPEGTRSRQNNNEMLSFKKGAFHVAIQAQIPVVPVVVATYSEAYSSKFKRFGGGVIPVKVLPPISTVGMTLDDVDALMKQTREVMVNSLQKMSMKPTSSETKKTN